MKIFKLLKNDIPTLYKVVGPTKSVNVIYYHIPSCPEVYLIEGKLAVAGVQIMQLHHSHISSNETSLIFFP